MKTQADDSAALLGENGWNIVTRLHPAEWWLDEVWAIESEWRKRGQVAYVSFLVEPQAPAQRKRGEHVWAVAVSTEGAASSWRSDDAIPLGPQWERTHRRRVAMAIEALRGVDEETAAKRV
jgi:hypothetical protein